MNPVFGKYRGKVTGNKDPMNLGRVQVSAPAVLGDGRLAWAMPCVPYAGPRVGLFAIPPVGANIWVEFEGGDPDLPIWSGCFWGKDELPFTPAVAETKGLKTEFVTITVDDRAGAGGLTVETKSGLKLALRPEGIELSNGAQKVALTKNNVSVNDGALEVT